MVAGAEVGPRLVIIRAAPPGRFPLIRRSTAEKRQDKQIGDDQDCAGESGSLLDMVSASAEDLRSFGCADALEWDQREDVIELINRFQSARQIRVGRMSLSMMGGEVAVFTFAFCPQFVTAGPGVVHRCGHATRVRCAR